MKNNSKTDPIVKCEICGTECYIRGGSHSGATNWYKPIHKIEDSIRIAIETLEKIADDYEDTRCTECSVGHEARSCLSKIKRVDK